MEELPFSLPDDIPNKDEINLAIANFCAVTNKQSELMTFVNLHDIDILCGTESHLDETILNSEIFPQNFNIFRKDRNIHGCGVFVMVKNTLLSSQVDTGVSCEIVWICIHNKAAHILIVGSFYCPPQSPISVLEELAKYIMYIKTEYPSSKVILAGDFNSPGIDWRNFREFLIDISSDYFLEHIVLEPTRGRNLLDLCFTTHPNQVKKCYTLPGFSDHEAVIVVFMTSIHMQKRHPRTIPLYDRANWGDIRQNILEIFEHYLQLNDQFDRSVK